MKLDDRVWQLGIQKGLWASDDRILVACSGGVDSMVLLEIFRLWAERGRISVEAIHCNHQLRGEESERDEKGVVKWCESHSIGLKVVRLPVLVAQETNGGNLEEIARKLRYEAIAAYGEEVRAAVIALGHHQNDQAETVLLHLLRGSGAFRGMKEKREKYIRPLLPFSKEEIYDFARERNLPFWEDSSNQNQEFRRNWIRRELLPLLKEKVNPEVEGALGRWASVAIEEEAFWEKYTEKWCAEHGDFSAGACSILLTELNFLTLAEKRRIFRRILFILRGNLKGIELSHVELLIRIEKNKIGGSRVKLPGGWQGRIFEKRLYIESTLEKGEKRDL
jgi:tRNA(Ile)-lysidine synthetase, N-terminal domain